MSVTLYPTDRLYWIAAASVNGIGYQTLVTLARLLHDRQQSWTEWWAHGRYSKRDGLSEQQILELKNWQQKWSPESYRDWLTEHELQTLVPGDDNFPTLLTEIPDLPAILFVQGAMPVMKQGFAMVGTRRMTAYGSMVAKEFGETVAREYQVPIVSGGMYGVDEAVHQAVIDAGGITVVVLGHGHHHPLNSQLASLYQLVTEKGGAVVSEYPPWQPALKGLFPARNRLVAGMTQGVLVIEAGECSGSHITAHLAAEYGREVFVIPGPITNPYSRGTTFLANEGAWLVTEPAQIAEQLGWSQRGVCFTKSPTSLSQEQEIITTLLRDMGPQSLSSLQRNSKKEATSVLQTLTQLRIHGIVTVRGPLWGLTRRVWHNDTLS